MLVAIVLFAEFLVALWFFVFISMMISMYLDSRGMKRPKMDVASRMLVGNAKYAFMTGMVALVIMTFIEIPFL